MGEEASAGQWGLVLLKYVTEDQNTRVLCGDIAHWPCERKARTLTHCWKFQPTGFYAELQPINPPVFQMIFQLVI